MSKQDHRSDRHLSRAHDVRQRVEHHLKSLHLQGASFDEAMESLTSLVIAALDETDAVSPRPSTMPHFPAKHAGANPLLADLREIPPRMSFTAVAALHFIQSQSQANPSELSHSLGVSPAAMTGTVDSLVRLGLVLRREDADDRRKIALELTGEGLQLAGRIFFAG
jgi:hypothetical protein